MSVVIRHDPIRRFVHPLLRVLGDGDAGSGAANLSDKGVARGAGGSRSSVAWLVRHRALVGIEGQDGARRRALRAAVDLMDSADTRVVLRGVDLTLQLLTDVPGRG
ncbi:hypothetical protein HN371_27660 [Candidatus Poribacteria bacterium]|nr:hypothetical protein [Candidatus Poribacteria bacterium]MBT5533710.1 hypothetical protein [Candidatus Poribacteria bacterium]MBT5714277.1 hypothetical protein [Candidatus Poribacteria bacterium]MBT7095940.1 hypothetical protein [Candidatus Poribacteria bacterium]MBT7807939.1 hypothetical protein [Candidatus Poribacteria bacterium]